jgi:hypothetical protein
LDFFGFLRVGGIERGSGVADEAFAEEGRRYIVGNKSYRKVNEQYVKFVAGFLWFTIFFGFFRFFLTDFGVFGFLRGEVANVIPEWQMKLLQR